MLTVLIYFYSIPVSCQSISLKEKMNFIYFFYYFKNVLVIPFIFSKCLLHNESFTPYFAMNDC